MTTFKNYTGHDINVCQSLSENPSDWTVYPSEGKADVKMTYTDFDQDGVCRAVYGPVTGLPDPVDGVKYIVSAVVMSNCDRTDIVAPTTAPGMNRRDKDKPAVVLCVKGFIGK